MRQAERPSHEHPQLQRLGRPGFAGRAVFSSTIQPPVKRGVAAMHTNFFVFSVLLVCLVSPTPSIGRARTAERSEA